MKLCNYVSGPLFDAVPNDGPGGGAGTPAAFDPAAFRTQLLGDVTKLFTSFGATLKADFAKATTPVPPAAEPEPVVVPDPAPGAVKPPVDPAQAAELRARDRQYKELSAQFAAMKTETDAKSAIADKKELDATVRTKLAKFKFADEFASQDAFDIFGSKVKRNEDGEFVGPDGTPIDMYLEEAMRSKPYLLAAKDVGGAGARGQGGSGVPVGKAIDIDTIKPGMSQADQLSVASQISAVLKSMGR